MKKILFGGVFDVIHPGHLYSLNAAKELGDYLIVVVANDTTLASQGRKVFHNHFERRDLVSSIRLVDKSIIGHPNNIYQTLIDVNPDIVALGYDQEIMEERISIESRRIGLKTKIIRLDSKYPEYSSTKIKKFYTSTM